MLERCYDKKAQEKHPTYKGCSVSNNFKSFQYFAEWCNNQVGFKIANSQLDKDILVIGNKLYSEDTCCFVPKEINVLFTNRAKLRGSCPIGVSFHESAGKYQANLRTEGVLQYLGLHANLEDAFTVYKEAKEAYVKNMAIKYKELLDEKVYAALLSWEVNMYD